MFERVSRATLRRPEGLQSNPVTVMFIIEPNRIESNPIIESNRILTLILIILTIITVIMFRWAVGLQSNPARG